MNGEDNMKIYLKSGQIVKLNEVHYAVSSKGDEYVNYDEYGIPRLQADKLMQDMTDFINDYVIEFFDEDNCLCFTTSIKQIIGIEE